MAHRGHAGDKSRCSGCWPVAFHAAGGVVVVRQIIVPCLILLVLFGAAVWEDLRSRRIPNAVVLAGLLASVLWHGFGPPGAWAFDREWPGATGFMGTTLAGLYALLGWWPLYRLGVLGAGDVKLFAAVAACLGGSVGHWAHVPGVALMVLLVGGALAVVRMVYRKLVRQVAINLWLWGKKMGTRWTERPDFCLGRDTADRMPYSLAIALGTFLYLVGSWNGYLTMV